MTEYSKELKEKAREKLLKEFDNLCEIGYGKLEVHFNLKSKNILIIPSPYFRVEAEEDEKC